VPIAPDVDRILSSLRLLFLPPRHKALNVSLISFSEFFSKEIILLWLYFGSAGIAVDPHMI
jgi:hypothetical protein